MGTHNGDPRWGPTPSDEDRHSVAVSLPCDGQMNVWSFWLSPCPVMAEPPAPQMGGNVVRWNHWGGDPKVCELGPQESQGWGL